ncbi:TIGR01440 family protein [Peribacillus asahii]|uniref:TIGR01440 family protein n=1 Tax=Peribacillus asahii TaxID=228899 RepID=UPI00207A6672|nr:TIGR01440 family protein [Peribacillus asahii]USK62147.1 TIGR01440 family protein [Peribacillus asahii]
MDEASFSIELNKWREQLRTILTEFQDAAHLNDKHLFVIGCSTSEVIGKRIGTEGTLAVAEMVYSELQAFQLQTGVGLAFQCCEHLNRALVLPREIAEQRGYEEVSVVPVRKAGGSMATYAYQQLNNPVVVEHITAEAGIDIGDTFIGMHIKHVAVPIRTSIKEVGHAHVTLAKTRPKLIGGERAVYTNDVMNTSC